MKRLLLRLVLLVPWVFLIWLIAQGMDGEISPVLVFILLFFLIPLSIILNLITLAVFHGHAAIKMIRQVQKRNDVGSQKLESENYADLSWWDVRRWRK